MDITKLNNIHISNIEFTKPVDPIKQGFNIDFSDKQVVLLVGDQGCGKSTILNAIYDSDRIYLPVEKLIAIYGDKFDNQKRHIDGEFYECIKKTFDDSSIVHMSSEFNNPRHMDYNSGDRNQLSIIRHFLNYVSSYVSDELYEEIRKLAPEYAQSITSDTDEINKSEFSHLKHRMKSHGQTMLKVLDDTLDTSDSLILLDEPELGLSIRSQYDLVNKINESCKRNNQFVISTHSLILMEKFRYLYDVNRCSYVESEDFINSMKPDNCI